MYVGLHGPGWLYVIGMPPRADVVRVGLHGRGWLYVLGMPSRAEVPLPTPRARATDLGRGPNRIKKMPKGDENTFVYIICTRFPFGMTQVEKDTQATQQ